jgi:hypothetical protein
MNKYIIKSHNGYFVSIHPIGAVFSPSQERALEFCNKAQAEQICKNHNSNWIIEEVANNEKVEL